MSILQKEEVLLFLKKDFIYLSMRDTQREAETQAEEKQAPCREPDAGLDPRTLGSLPEPKADAQPLSPPGAPEMIRMISALRRKEIQTWFIDGSAQSAESRWLQCYSTTHGDPKDSGKGQFSTRTDS